MITQTFNRSGKGRIAIAAATVMLGASILAVAADKKPPAPAPKAAPAARPAAPASHPAASGSTAGHTTTTTGSHAATTTTTGSHPTTTTTGSHPTTTTGSHPTTTGSTTHPGTTGTTGHPGTAPSAAAHPNAAGNTSLTRVSAPKGTTPSHSAISKPVPKGVTEKTTKDGSAIRTRPNGKVSDVHDAKRGMDIHHGLDGSRRVTVERKDGSRLVAERGRPGYVQRGYGYHGHEYVTRSYYYHGGYYHNYYRGYYYGGVYMNVYSPGYYYGPGFYGWAYNPWAVPINYGWGWGGNPWYGYYGFYFHPYPVYPSAAFWLTDYLVSAGLQAAYAARQAAAAEAVAAADAPAAPDSQALSPEIKQQIADEVKAQLALENSEAAQTTAGQEVDPGSSSIARLLADGKTHVFVADGSLDVTNADGQECPLSDGDALALTTPPATDATSANLIVLASKGGQECAKQSTVAVALTDLQEMQNHLRESIDKGLAELKSKQGQGGLPQAPASAQAAPAQAGYAAIAPPPAPTDAADIQAQTAEADKSEAEVASAAQNNAAELTPARGVPLPPPATPARATIEMGQSLEDVKSRAAKLVQVTSARADVNYYYPDREPAFA